jgi:photosystem II stability/assembly factor-like uncharacterized protein
MKKFLFSLIAILLLAASGSSQEYTPWKWSHQKPQGNNLLWLQVFNANTWYMVGLNGTFMKTTNAGVNWYFHHKAGVNIGALGNTTSLNSAWFFNMNTGIAGGNVSGSQSIVRTTNGGVTWDTASGLISGPFWSDFHFPNSTTGFSAGSTSGRFAKTTDAGLTWTVAGTTIPTLPTATYNGIHATDANTIYIVSSVASGSNVRVSTDGGATWDPDTAGTTTLNDVSFMNANTGFVVGATGNVWRTTDAGETWVTKPTGNTSAYQRVVFRGSEVFVVGDAFNIYRSTNLGDNWTAMPFLAPVAQQPWTSTYYHLGFAGDTMVTVGASGLINRSTNNGANWTTFTSYVKAGALNDVHAISGTGSVWAVGAPGSTGSVFDQVMFSSNGGASWVFQPIPGSTATFNSISMLNALTGYIGGTTGRVRKTTNGGTTWDSVETNFTFIVNRIKFVNPSTGWVFGSTAGNVSKTTDGGATWEAQVSGLTTAINDADFVDANTGWLVSTLGNIRKTTNGGANWDAQVSNYGSTLNDIKMVDANTGYVVGLTGNMRKTTNGGTNWDTVLTPVSTTLGDVDFVNANNGVIVGLSGYSAKTTNGGSTWEVFNSGAGTLNAVDMVHPDTMFAAGLTGGVHRYAEGTVGTVIWSSEIPLIYTLHQNYPNPFNPSTTIKFALPKAGFVSLKVYDITGREVKELFNNQQLNAGTVTYDFDGTNLASGVYFYTLIVDNNKIDTKRMVLVK